MQVCEYMESLECPGVSGKNNPILKNFKSWPLIFDRYYALRVGFLFKCL